VGEPALQEGVQGGGIGEAPARATTAAATSSPRSAWGRPNDGDVLNGGMLEQDRFDAGSGDVLAGPDDNVLGAAGEGEAVVVEAAEVARCGRSLRRR